MTWRSSHEPVCDKDTEGRVQLRIDGRPRNLGGFDVRRVLPSAKRRMVGPFVFLDHFGPATLGPDQAMDVRPHPHIHLATISYLFEGGVMHRDSLGSALEIEPGAVNWMHAGRGIVHSERSPERLEGKPKPMHGLQAWVALPDDAQDSDPFFQHVPATEIPKGAGEGVSWTLVAGTLGDRASPVRAASELLYVVYELDAGATVELPDHVSERALYVVSGAVHCGGEDASTGTMLVLEPGPVSVHATESAVLALVGGEPVGQRHIEWNFVSSTKEAIEEAKRQWREDDVSRFPKVPGDEDERIPLP